MCSPRVEVLKPAVDFRLTWHAVTSTLLSPAARVTAWRIVHETLPVQAFVYKYRISDVAVCPLCQTYLETTVLLFLQCVTVRPIWVRIETVFRFNLPLSSNKLVYFNFSKADDALTPTVTVVVTDILHAIWLCRNRGHWDKEILNTNAMLAFCLGRLRVRVKADFGRLTPGVFQAFWSSQTPCVRVGPAGLSLDF